MVLFSSAITNQFYVIPMAALVLIPNLGFLAYTAMVTFYLVIDQDGLHWPRSYNADANEEILFFLFVGLVAHILADRKQTRFPIERNSAPSERQSDPV